MVLFLRRRNNGVVTDRVTCCKELVSSGLDIAFGLGRHCAEKPLWVQRGKYKKFDVSRELNTFAFDECALKESRMVLFSHRV